MIHKMCWSLLALLVLSIQVVHAEFVLQEGIVYSLNAEGRSLTRVDRHATKVSGNFYLKNDRLYTLGTRNRRILVGRDVTEISYPLFLRGSNLYLYDASNNKTYYVDRNITQVANHYFLKGDRLYRVTLASVQPQIRFITRGVTKTFDGTFLKRNTLFKVEENRNLFHYIANNVSHASADYYVREGRLYALTSDRESVFITAGVTDLEGRLFIKNNTLYSAVFGFGYQRLLPNMETLH